MDRRSTFRSAQRLHRAPLYTRPARIQSTDQIRYPVPEAAYQVRTRAEVFALRSALMPETRLDSLVLRQCQYLVSALHRLMTHRAAVQPNRTTHLPAAWPENGKGDDSWPEQSLLDYWRLAARW